VSAQSSFAELARSGGRGALVTNLEGGDDKLLVHHDGRTEGTLGNPALDEEAAKHADELMWAERAERRGDLFIDVTFPPPRLIIFGAVDFAAALCKMASVTGWRAFVVDPRARFAQPARFPDAEEVVAAWPEEAFHRLGGIDRATAIAVLTHDPKLDDAALVLALRSNAGYIGAMGSRRAQEKRREHLGAIADAVHGPVGLDLGGEGPAEVALEILAEILQTRKTGEAPAGAPPEPSVLAER
jgi:xanthine dehydrogenase accessory factor